MRYLLSKHLVLGTFVFTIAAATPVRAAESESLSDLDPSACEQLAGLPNTPMSVETCRAMLGGQPGDVQARHPGDEAMNCEQIFAELRGMEVEGMSDQNLARNEVLTEEGRALSTRHAAEMARQATPSPLALVSSLLPNAVGAALMAPEQARTVAATRNLQRADQRYNAQLGQQMSANAEDLDALMANNPRLARLSQLAIAKDCQAPLE